MTLAVGGLSGLHDELIAAALRCHGVAAEPLPTPDAAALATGRALLARGHCNPTYLLAGALVEHARRVGDELTGYVAAGTCGPCRFATYPDEFRRALAAAGLARVRGAAVDVVEPRPTAALSALRVELTAALVRSLARAAIVADAVTRAGCTHRAAAVEPAAIDMELVTWRPRLAAAIARGRRLEPVLRGLGARLGNVPRDPAAGRRVRVRITGQMFAALTDGPGGFRLARWLEQRGAVVEPPAVAEWLLYALWSARSPSPYRAARPDARAHRVRALERGVQAWYARCARALGARPAALADADELAALAAPHYPPALRGGLGHLEVAELLRAQRDRSAELVVSIKPFGCLPSSAISDGVARELAARCPRVVFEAIETSGEGGELAASRLELALDRARALVDRDQLRPGPELGP